MLKQVYDKLSQTLWDITEVRLEDDRVNSIPMEATIYSMDIYNADEDKTIKNVGLAVVNTPTVYNLTDIFKAINYMKDTKTSVYNYNATEHFEEQGELYIANLVEGVLINDIH